LFVTPSDLYQVEKEAMTRLEIGSGEAISKAIKELLFSR